MFFADSFFSFFFSLDRGFRNVALNYAQPHHKRTINVHTRSSKRATRQKKKKKKKCVRAMRSCQSLFVRRAATAAAARVVERGTEAFRQKRRHPKCLVLTVFFYDSRFRRRFRRRFRERDGGKRQERDE